MRTLLGHRNKLIAAALLLVALAVPLVVQNDYILGVVILAYIWAIAVYGLNILLGYTGQLTLAHAGFFGIGAYTVGILTVDYGVLFWAALVAGVALTGVLGFLIGIFALRTREEYFAIFTLGVGFVIYLVLERWEGLTGGPRGLIGVPYPEGIGPIQFDGPESIYYLVLAFLILAIYISITLSRSLLGRTFMAIRNSEELAKSLGVNVGRNKQLSFTISTSMAGLAGGLYATYIGFLGPAVFNVNTSFEMLMYLLVGGIASISGPLVGAFIVTILFESFQQFQEYRLLVLGPVVILILIFFPRGLAGLARSLTARLRGPAADKPRAGKSESPRTESQEVG